MEVALDLLSFPIYCWPWTRLLRCGPNLVFKRTEMMRPLLGIVFSPSDKRGLTGPLLHTMVTNRLVTELHPDWDHNMQWRMSCPDQDYVRCQKQERNHFHVLYAWSVGPPHSLTFSLQSPFPVSAALIHPLNSVSQPRFVLFRLLWFVCSLNH